MSSSDVNLSMVRKVKKITLYVCIIVPNDHPKHVLELRISTHFLSSPSLCATEKAAARALFLMKVHLIKIVNLLRMLTIVTIYFTV